MNVELKGALIRLTYRDDSDDEHVVVLSQDDALELADDIQMMVGDHRGQGGQP